MQASVSLHKSRLGGELRELAYQDVLTGLGNRALLISRLTERLRRTPGGAGTALLFIDIDDFKTVNDSLGHDTGDRLLGAIGGRLRGCLRDRDVATRLGGDEFAVLLGGGASVEVAAALADRLVTALRGAFTVDETRIMVRASVGVVALGGHPEDARVSPDEVLRRADLAMYCMKSEGKDGWRLYEASMQEAVVERHRLQNDLRGAVERGEVTVLYQPIVRLEDGRVVGAEALARWEHPERGQVGPERFIPIAEETEVILAIGDHVLRTALGEAARWLDTCPEFRLSVNVSGRQLHDVGFPARVGQHLAATGIDPGRLTLEITESIMVTGDPAIGRAVGELRAMGVRIAIDDFGTGYSSLSLLSTLPVDSLKIAKPFVDALVGEGREAVLAAAIVGLGRTLDLTLVAEGVEVEEQAEALRALGCGHAQGWLFGHPAIAAELEALLVAWGRRFRVSA